MHTPALFAQIFSQGRDEEDNCDLIQPIEQVTQASWLADSCRDGPTWAWESVHVAKCKRRVLTLKSEINIHCFTDDDHVHVSWNTETGPFFLRNFWHLHRTSWSRIHDAFKSNTKTVRVLQIFYAPKIEIHRMAVVILVE